MQSFPDMAEAHEWTLRRLREMAGRLTEQAYLRASAAGAEQDEEAAQRWMLVFDRMARGLRLSIALEAKLARERRWDARQIRGEMVGEAQGERHAPYWRRARAPSAADAEPRESDREQDDDGLPADAALAQRLDRLKAILDGGGSPEPAAPRVKFEWRALDGDHIPDEPWPNAAGNVLTPADPTDAPPWRGSG